jgi:hypothetical protein
MKTDVCLVLFGPVLYSSTSGCRNPAAKWWCLNICYVSCTGVNHTPPKRGAFVCWCDMVLIALSLLCIYTVYVCADLVCMGITV